MKTFRVLCAALLLWMGSGLAAKASAQPGSWLQISALLDPTDQILAEFGQSVSPAGDVNGDTYDDLLVGAPWWSGQADYEGRAYLFLGSATGLQADPITMDPTDLGGAYFGGSVAAAGDVNNDGYDDVIVGAPNTGDPSEVVEQPGGGRAYLYLGSASGPQSSYTTLEPTSQVGAEFGSSVASAGDVNNDGYDDVVIGTPYWTGQAASEGRSYLYLGSASGLQASPVTFDPTDQAEAKFGSSVASAGDVNNDGYDEVIVGAPEWDGESAGDGRAYLYLGSASGLQVGPVLDPVYEFWGGAEFGSAVASAGDTDGDSYDDVVVGAPLWTGENWAEGAIYLYRGSATGLQLSPATFDPADAFHAHFGASVASAGDVNQDDRSDLIVGAPWWTGQQTNEGRTFLYLGSASGLLSDPATLDPADQTSANFGNSVASAGDVENDGYDEVVVGAPQWDGQQIQEGRAYLAEVANPPSFDPISDQTVAENEELWFTVSATDPDERPLTYSALSLPDGASFDPATHTFTWTPDYSQSGAHNVTFRAENDIGLYDEESVTITVVNVDRPPVLTPIGNKTVAENQLLEFTVTATDPDGDPITYSATGLPAGATLNAITGAFKWRPTYEQAGTYEVGFRAESSGGLFDERSMTITVTNAPKPESTTTLRVEVNRSALKPHGNVRPNDDDHPGLPVKVTLFKRKLWWWEKLRTKTPELTATGTYATRFDRPGHGTYKITAEFSCTHHKPSSAVVKISL
jgi:Putative Ig domain/FG-GAP repeat